MNVELSQVVSLLSRLDPSLTKDFLLSSSIPFVLCSGGLINAFHAYEYGTCLSICALPIFNALSVWRRGVTLPAPVLLYNGVVSAHGLVQAIYIWQRNRDNRFIECMNQFIIEPSEFYSYLRDGSFLVKLGNWLFTSGMMSYWNTIPYLYTLRADGLSPSGLIGLSLIAVGAVLQAVADYQKKRHKNENGALSFCTDGLYSLCRHPNYLGEILIHLGVLISGYSLFPSIPRWLLVGAVPLVLGTSMFFITSDMASKQAMKYSSNSKYRDYQRSVKKLIPFIW